MPFEVLTEGDGQFVVVTQGTKKVHGRFKTKEEAEAQMRALYANDVQCKALTDETIIYFGEAVKALGEGGKVGGYLVRFGTPESADCQGEFFTQSTDFGLDLAAKARVVYHHGLPRNDDLSRQLGRSRIGIADLSILPDGLYATAQLDLNREPVKALYDLIEAGKIGWSSGSTERLVEREPVKGKVAIKSWPIIEASLSPTPVDPRNRALAIKSLIDEPTGSGAVAALSLIDRADVLVADADAIRGLFAKSADQRAAEGRSLSPAKRAAIKGLAGAFSELYAATAPQAPTPDHSALARRLLQQRIEALHAGSYRD